MFSTRLRALSVFVVLAAAGSGLLLAQSPQEVGTWVGVGAADNPFGNGAHVDVGDGHTLIVGGTAPDGAATNVVANFDTATNQFAIAGTLLSARTGHTATLLKDGRVLVAGGTTNSLVSTDIELFDPSTGSSTLVAQMAEPRRVHVAALLQNGNVLIAGGYTTGDVVLQSAFLFDPATNAVSPTPGGLQVARASASATSLIDGRVVIVGGTDGTNDLRSAEIYDPYLQSFSTVSTQLSVPVHGHSAVLLPHNGSVLIAGGTSNGAAQTGVDLFLPAQFPDPFSWGVGQFAPTAAMSAARSSAIAGPTATEGYAVVTGGGSNGVERYRFATIKTDKDDYPPGERALITGTGWQPGEEVRLVFQEDPAVHDDYVLTVTADGVGNISHDQWAPEAHDANVRFYLMATGQQSGRRAQMTFTDSVGVSVTSAPFVWHRTGEVSGGFNVSVAGTYTCTSGSGGNNCTSVTNLTITVSGAAGSKVLSGLATGDSVAWSTTLEFRTAPAVGQFSIPGDGRYDVTATLNSSPNSPNPATRQNYFGIDNTAPNTSITCNNAACANPYTASVQVRLQASDGGGQVSGVVSTLYCVDTTDTCTPTTAYPGGGGFTVAFVAGTTNFVRYFSTDQVGNIETTKSQTIQFQAAAVAVTVTTAPTGLNITVDGTTYTAPQTFNWTPGSSHTIATTSPQSGGSGVQYVWANWSDGGAISHTVTASAATTTYAANFQTQYELRFNLSGVDGDYTGTVVTIGGSAIASSAFASNSYTQWVDANSTAPTVAWSAPLASTATGKQYRFVDTTPLAGLTSPVTGPQTLTGNYQRQWLLTFNLAGVDNDYTGTVVTVGGTPIASSAFLANSNSYLHWVDAGSTPTVLWTGLLTSSVPGKRYDFIGAAPPFITPVNLAQTITATYQKQWLLTFTLSGVNADYTGTVVTIGGSAIPSGDFIANSNSHTEWVNHGSTAPTVVWADPLLSTVTGKRYLFVGADSLSATITAAQTITATYQKQWLLTLSLNGVDNDDTGTVVTINGSAIAHSSFSANSYTQWVNDGLLLSLDWADPLTSSVTGKRYDFTGSAPALITPVTTAQSITASYQRQYLLTFNLSGVDNDYTGTVFTIGSSTIASTDFASNSYAQWVDAGPAPTVVWTDPLASTVTGKQYDFLSATALISPVAAPQTITATYQKQWLVKWTQTGLAGTGAHTVVTIGGQLKTLAMLPYSQWFNHGAGVSYAYSSPISTDPASNIQFELNSATSVLPSTASIQSALDITGDYSTSTYTIQYLQPLDQSDGTTYHENAGKNGRVIPVKVLIFKNGTAIADTSTVLMKVVGAQCVGGTGVVEPIEEYADAGASNGNTNLFRWSSPQWIYNLDTKAVGLQVDKCYRLDVYVTAVTGPTAIKASAATFAIFRPVK